MADSEYTRALIMCRCRYPILNSLDPGTITVKQETLLYVRLLFLVEACLGPGAEQVPTKRVTLIQLFCYFRTNPLAPPPPQIVVSRSRIILWHCSEDALLIGS